MRTERPLRSTISCGYTVPAPAGIGAPVMMRSASPGADRAVEDRARGQLGHHRELAAPARGNVLRADRVAVHRGVGGGRHVEGRRRTSSASTRPRQAPTAATSGGAIRVTCARMWACASATEIMTRIIPCAPRARPHPRRAMRVLRYAPMASSCPQCGWSPADGTHCPRCGVDVARYRADLAAASAMPAPAVDTAAPGRPRRLARPRRGPRDRDEAPRVPPPTAARAIHPAGFWGRAGGPAHRPGPGDGGGGGLRIRRSGRSTDDRLAAAASRAFRFLASPCYFVFLHWARGQTLGKMLFRIRVVMLDGAPLAVRACPCFVISAPGSPPPSSASATCSPPSAPTSARCTTSSRAPASNTSPEGGIPCRPARCAAPRTLSSARPAP